MELKMIIAGFGGQGVMVMGKLLCYTACDVGKKAIFLPQYGSEQRGGTASCSVIISDEEIGAPVIGKADVIVVFNQPSLDKFLPCLKKDGTLFMNSSLCKLSEMPDDIHIVALPVDALAKEMGARQVANIMMSGALIAETGIFTEAELQETVKHVLGKKSEMIALNEAAVEKGIAFVKEGI